MNTSSGRDATSVTANSERGESVGISASFENGSGNNNVLHVSIVNDETRHDIPDEVSELSVPETRFDRQTHTHHSCKHCPIRQQIVKIVVLIKFKFDGWFMQFFGYEKYFQIFIRKCFDKNFKKRVVAKNVSYRDSRTVTSGDHVVSFKTMDPIVSEKKYVKPLYGHHIFDDSPKKWYS